MTDIVERLREAAGDAANSRPPQLLREAADEIEWLRGIPDDLVCVLNAEIERLRGELANAERALAAFDSVEVEE